MTAMNTPYEQIRADHDDETLVVYQAYPPQIADEALRLGTFGPSFSCSRITWIKPSFRWMLYRCGWSAKPGQERVLAVQIRRDGFEWALRNSGLSHYDAALHTDRVAWEATRHRPVRLQWDPERDPRLHPLNHRSLQISISGDAVTRYCDQWISAIDDATDLARDRRPRHRRPSRRRGSAAPAGTALPGARRHRRDHRQHA